MTNKKHKNTYISTRKLKYSRWGQWHDALISETSNYAGHRLNRYAEVNFLVVMTEVALDKVPLVLIRRVCTYLRSISSYGMITVIMLAMSEKTSSNIKRNWALANHALHNNTDQSPNWFPRKFNLLSSALFVLCLRLSLLTSYRAAYRVFHSYFSFFTKKTGCI